MRLNTSMLAISSGAKAPRGATARGVASVRPLLGPPSSAATSAKAATPSRVVNRRVVASRVMAVRAGELSRLIWRRRAGTQYTTQ